MQSISNRRRLAPARLYCPRTAVVAGQPLRIAGAADEGKRLRVPLDFLAVEVGQIHQVAADGGVPADLLTGDRLLAGLHTLQEITEMALAFVEFDLRVLQEGALRFLHLGHAGGLLVRLTVLFAGVGGDHLVAALHRELAAVDLHFTFRAEEVDAEAIHTVSSDGL